MFGKDAKKRGSPPTFFEGGEKGASFGTDLSGMAEGGECQRSNSIGSVREKLRVAPGPYVDAEREICRA